MDARLGHLETLPEPQAFDLRPPTGGRARVIGIESRSLTTRDLVADVTDPSAPSSSGTNRVAVGSR